MQAHANRTAEAFRHATAGLALHMYVDRVPSNGGRDEGGGSAKVRPSHGWAGERATVRASEIRRQMTLRNYASSVVARPGRGRWPNWRGA